MNFPVPSSASQPSDSSDSNGLTCPKCGSAGSLHRSHSANLYERMVKGIFPYRIYLCDMCEARIWLREGQWFRWSRGIGNKNTLLFLLVVLILAAVLVYLLLVYRGR